MYLNKIFVLLFLSITIAGCKDYYNETIEWVDNLERGLNIETVQRRQPNYIEIDWENPQVIENQKWYLIVKIKGNSDILNMSHYLVFVENKYQYRESRK
ncbi:hypothetical protein HZY62_12260 [Maribacter polysiphoniae]|uniref:Lipoprotein n=1 Tax=Maribacter polysiphoniae TaxID=429344 RepID=A0A316DX73_9FLAO|nr:hypothetical protein [Maribacter polysiphoniae]MBD1261369.1 hypothetical protein [Maribacter polysiphoniae]PWK22701.1 hypothetical protein LX92_02637 [Maribacter polysiphoniae]